MQASAVSSEKSFHYELKAALNPLLSGSGIKLIPWNRCFKGFQFHSVIQNGLNDCICRKIILKRQTDVDLWNQTGISQTQ